METEEYLSFRHCFPQSSRPPPICVVTRIVSGCTSQLCARAPLTPDLQLVWPLWAAGWSFVCVQRVQHIFFPLNYSMVYSGVKSTGRNPRVWEVRLRLRCCLLHWCIPKQKAPVVLFSNIKTITVKFTPKPRQHRNVHCSNAHLTAPNGSFCYDSPEMHFGARMNPFYVLSMHLFPESSDPPRG